MWSIYVIVTVGVLVGLFVFCTLKKSNEKQKNEDRENFVKIFGIPPTDPDHRTGGEQIVIERVLITLSNNFFKDF